MFQNGCSFQDGIGMRRKAWHGYCQAQMRVGRHDWLWLLVGAHAAIPASLAFPTFPLVTLRDPICR